MADGTPTPSRREFLRTGLQGAALVSLGSLGVKVLPRSHADKTVWQIDPYKCIQCERCAVNCVLTPSAVKCVHAFPLCGYCDLCTGFFVPNPIERKTGAENQLCPAGAIKRAFVEDPYYEYQIDEPLCIGCSKCVKGLHIVRQRVAASASAARSLPQLRRVFHCRVVPVERL